MILVQEAKLYPNKTQEKLLNTLFEQSRLFYNAVLEKKINHYKETNKSLSQIQLQKIFKITFTDIPASLRQALIYRVITSFDRFFKKQNNYPRFKSFGRLRSLELRQYKRDYRFKNGKLKLWKTIGSLKMRGFREAEDYGMARIVKRASGFYFQYLIEIKEARKIKKVKSAIGIDVGLKSFLVDSKGEKVIPPKFFVKTQFKLRSTQRKLSKGLKGSKRREKNKVLVGKVYEKIANQRKDFLHKFSRQYANSDLIVAEDLNIKGLIKNRHLSKAILDASWAKFMDMIDYKSKILGHHFIKVNPKYTSQNCSNCGNLVRKSLSIRTHICDCGYIADRDENAARNILKKGLGEAIVENIAIASSVKRELAQAITPRD